MLRMTARDSGRALQQITRPAMRKPAGQHATQAINFLHASFMQDPWTLCCHEPDVLTTSFMFNRLTPLNGFGALSIVPVPVAFA